mmetsp:Transcript_88893/g.246954  ORF Transcript_88893/g.246954 Transcript_88893/m.246954 type:complete len:186 (+) Transcript_88893:134-691(+)
MNQTTSWEDGFEAELSVPASEEAAVLARFEEGIFGKPLGGVETCGTTAVTPADERQTPPGILQVEGSGQDSGMGAAESPLRKKRLLADAPVPVTTSISSRQCDVKRPPRVTSFAISRPRASLSASMGSRPADGTLEFTAGTTGRTLARVPAAKVEVSIVCQVCMRGFETDAKLKRQNLAKLRDEI